MIYCTSCGSREIHAEYWLRVNVPHGHPDEIVGESDDDFYCEDCGQECGVTESRREAALARVNVRREIAGLDPVEDSGLTAGERRMLRAASFANVPDRAEAGRAMPGAVGLLFAACVAFFALHLAFSLAGDVAAFLAHLGVIK